VGVSDLFTPTITAQATTGRPPWSVPALVFPALVGGPLAVTVLGLINGRRLRIGTAGQASVAVAGVVAFGLRLLAAALLGGSAGGGRIASGLAGALAYGVVTYFQQRPYRAFALRGGDSAGLLWPGVAATVGAIVVDLVCTAIVLLAVGE
jgi:hypothetical protein